MLLHSAQKEKRNAAALTLYSQEAECSSHVMRKRYGLIIRVLDDRRASMLDGRKSKEAISTHIEIRVPVTLSIYPSIYLSVYIGCIPLQKFAHLIQVYIHILIHHSTVYTTGLGCMYAPLFSSIRSLSCVCVCVCGERARARARGRREREHLSVPATCCIPRGPPDPASNLQLTLYLLPLLLVATAASASTHAASRASARCCICVHILPHKDETRGLILLVLRQPRLSQQVLHEFSRL